MSRVILSSIKNVVTRIRQEVEEFKEDHPAVSKAISKTIDNMLPEPYKTLCGIFWEGIKKEDNSTEKIIELLEKLEREGEINGKLLTEIGDKISEFIKSGANSEQIQKLADQMRTSNQSLMDILNSQTERLNQIYNEVDKVRKQIAGDEVTYRVIEFGDNDEHAIIQNIASAINVEVDEDGNGKSNVLTIPFVPFVGFYDLKVRNKILLYGKSGCGKSRSIIELIRDKISNHQIDKVYIIHPQDSRKNSSRISISELVDDLKDNDMVIWDDFPDDLKQAVIVRQGRNVLAVISHRNVKNLIVALKPEVLELYRKDIRIVNSYLTGCEVTFDDKDQIKNIIQSYGENIDRYKKLYQDVISKDLDNITNAIYNIERTPSFIRLCYEILIEVAEKADRYPKDKYDFDKMVSEKLWHPKEFYKTQIDTLLNTRSNDAFFLYTIKLFYELGFERTYKHIKRLQKEIFNSSSPQNPFKDLSTWIFPSTGEYGVYYSMLALPKDSLNYTIDMLANMISYFTINFENLVKDVDVNLIYNFGYFIGKNIKLVSPGSNNPLLPNKMYEHIIIDFVYTKKYHFLGGICVSISENFPRFDRDTQERILKLVSRDADFGPLDYYLSYFLGMSLGSIFNTLDNSLQVRLLAIMQTSNNEFSKRMIWVLAIRFSILDKEFQGKILELIRQRSELSYLGLYVMSDFVSIDKEIQWKILELIETRNEFASWFGSLISIFPDLNIEVQLKILELGERREDIASILIALNFASINQIQVQEQVLKIAENGQAIGLIIIHRLAEEFTSLNKEYRQKVLESACRSENVGTLLGSFLKNKLNGFDNDLKKEIETAARKSAYFARTLGLDEIVNEIINQQLEVMTNEERDELLTRAKKIAEEYSQK